MCKKVIMSCAQHFYDIIGRLSLNHFLLLFKKKLRSSWRVIGEAVWCSQDGAGTAGIFAMPSSSTIQNRCKYFFLEKEFGWSDTVITTEELRATEES